MASSRFPEKNFALKKDLTLHLAAVWTYFSHLRREADIL
jgi:hypothetical protein